MIYCVEAKNDAGNLINLYAGFYGGSLSISLVYSHSAKFHNRDSAEEFRGWLIKSKKISSKNLEVTEHEEI